MNNMTTETMKETTRKVLGTAALFIGSFCVMGCVETPVKAQPSAAPSGLVDPTSSVISSDSGAEAANSGKYRLRNVKVQVRE